MQLDSGTAFKLKPATCAPRARAVAEARARRREQGKEEGKKERGGAGAETRGLARDGCSREVRERESTHRRVNYI